MKMINPNLHGIKAGIFYYCREDVMKKWGISNQELVDAGVTNKSIVIADIIIKPLKNVQNELAKYGFNFSIKDGYRSQEIYKLAYKKRVESIGKEESDKLFNMDNMPHSTGLAVDIGLEKINGTAVYFYNSKRDGQEAYSYGFYKNSTLNDAKAYHKLQKMLFDTMTKNGFKLGSKNECWHYEYVIDQKNI